MANCIAIETSSEACSVSLSIDGTISGTSISSPKTHAKSLLPFIHDLMSARQVHLRDLDFIACSEGPGSFTGLRIGLGVAQGLAFGAGKPMVAVSSLAAMARAAHLQHPDAHMVVSLLDARMAEIYWSVTEFSSASSFVVAKPGLNSIADVTVKLTELANTLFEKNLLIAGVAGSLLGRSNLHEPRIFFDESIAPNATQVAEIALESWAAGGGCSPEDFQLNYLRNSVSWNKRQRIRT